MVSWRFVKAEFWENIAEVIRMYGYNYGRPIDPATVAYQQRLMEMQRAGYSQPQPYQQPNYGGYEQMQQVPAQQQPMPAPMNNTPKMRVVTSIEEARAAQIDLDGTPTLFRSPAEGKIYEKSIGLDGLPVFNIYQRVDAASQPQPVYAEHKAVQELQERVTQLENLLKGAGQNVSTANDASANGHVAKQ